jgi:DNA (cytosine-5)-methyltransferase 1
MTLTFGSLFAGIGGFDLGLKRAGWTGTAQVEIDPRCRDVLARHFPDARRHDDVTTASAATIGAVDLLCGGFPCQDLSVAGRRAGLAGARSGLFHEFMRLAAELAPRWVLIENVPGLLSSNGGGDMGVVLGTLGQLGYGWAYRSLDAQYFGLAQRRERVFIVGCLGDAARAAAVLFEPESGGGDPAPRRAAGEGTAATLTAGAHPGSHNGQDDHKDGKRIPVVGGGGGGGAPPAAPPPPPRRKSGGKASYATTAGFEMLGPD